MGESDVNGGSSAYRMCDIARRTQTLECLLRDEYFRGRERFSEKLKKMLHRGDIMGRESDFGARYDRYITSVTRYRRGLTCHRRETTFLSASRLAGIAADYTPVAPYEL